MAGAAGDVLAHFLKIMFSSLDKGKSVIFTLMVHM